jgi:hypothetical protein
MNTTYSSSSTQDVTIRKDIVNSRHRFGIFFGVVVGLAFVAATWGFDAIVLARAHAYQPWLKLIVGVLVCAPVGGLAGWVAALLEKPVLSVLVWLGAVGVFAWLSTANSFQIFPALVVNMNPDFASFINYSIETDLATRTYFIYFWVAIFGGLVGVLQIPLSERAVFSTSAGAKLFSLLLPVAIVVLCGIYVDNYNNEPLRSPIVSENRVVEFAIETRGQNVDPALAREMRRYAIRDIEDWLGQPYFFIVSSFDSDLGQVHVYANFGGKWADCPVNYAQPSICIPVSP